mgnify:FL=1|tara:strand:+ start:7671 stop:8537 length:867 start_codon:yes stop_codon:yes gene_type:complete
MKHFNSFLTEADEASTTSQQPQRVSDDVMTTFGRHNPPHMGHKLTLDHANDLAGNIGENAQADQRFYTSRSQDPKKNPLPYEMKMDHLKRMFPDHSEKWDSDDRVRTVLGAATKANDDGYKNFHFVGGGDRKQGMEDLLRKYNGNLYNFDNIYSHSAGERDENMEGDDPIAKLSASRQRKAAMNGDFDGFAEGLGIGENYTMEDAQELFQNLRQFMVKNEDWQVDYRGNREVIRDLYLEGRLYSRGDVVESLSSGLIGEVHRCGTNHLICITEDGVMFKNFIHDVQSI